MKYTAIRSEGGLIPYDLLEQIANEQVPGQKPSDFGLSKDRRLSDEILRVWSDAQDFWDVFRRRMASPSERDPYGTTETRERWLYPLLGDPQTFAYDLKLQSSAISVNGASFPISHLAGDSPDAPPVHIEGFRVDLDHRRPNLRTSPRAMVQECLNRGESLWGIATNGVRFLLLRNSARTARPTYLDFDLQTILEGNHFHEFALFYRLCHRSRLPRAREDPTKCLLEQYYLLSIEQGGRVREKLRVGVEEALKIFGTGFLRHPANTELRQKIDSGRVKADEYHRQLLRLVYRLLFLMVAEERRLIAAAGDDTERKQRIYDDFYSVARLRERAEDIVEEGVFADLWIGLKLTFSLFSDTRDQNPLGISPLNGELFGYRAISDLEGTELYNHDLLRAIRRLSLFREDKVLHRVNYSALGVEELGSVYESLLDFQPLVGKEPEGPKFELHQGGERRSTGSYYTRPELVRELIQSALVPVIEDRLAESETVAKGKLETEAKAAKEKTILGISVCDPACGSGHFLLEAARRLGRELARIRTGQDEPSPEEFHLAVRDAISHCIYGVDLNPLAVDLCKLALWLEGHWVGKPLSFLDHRIKCGNSLVGVLNTSVLEKGIPDEAFSPVTGDDKKVASAYKKRNKKEREMLLRRLDFEAEESLAAFAKVSGEAMDFPEDRPEDVRRKEELYRKGRERKEWLHDWTAANLWTAAFFVPLTGYDDPVVPTEETFMDYLLHGKDRPQMTGYANAMFWERHFFHWRLEFPDVFDKGGFDVVLGNPPWERIKLQEEEHWVDDPHISSAPNKASRAARLEEYRKSGDPKKLARLALFEKAKHSSEALAKFVRDGGRFPFTSTGDINTYALFVELARTMMRNSGRVGIIVPTGIATDETYKEFFQDLTDHKAVVSIFDFENRDRLFPDVYYRMKFALVTLSALPVKEASFGFYLTRPEQIKDEMRRFSFTREDMMLVNPNTQTCPVFRTRVDAELTKKIYRNVPALDSPRSPNPWGIHFLTMFHMANDSGLFRTSKADDLVPLYEGKMIQAYDHRAASIVLHSENINRDAQPEITTIEQHGNPSYQCRPRYWVRREEVDEILAEWKSSWLVCFKDVASTTNERTCIFTVLPRVGVGHTVSLVLFKDPDASRISCFLAGFNSLVLDYIARQKLGGLHLTFSLLRQLPVLPPSNFGDEDREFVSSRVVRLVYTSHDTSPFARDLGCTGSPFVWDEASRDTMIAELDAYYAHLYGLARRELEYVLDPQDVFGGNFPGETFRTMKERDLEKYGEYRTRRLVLEAFDRLAELPRFSGEKRECVMR